jgi:glycine/D-amino acid oxidase-like deaminating enzyme
VSGYDVVVVGGGVAGTSCAYHLRRLGAGRVLLLERGSLAAGSSSRSTGFVETGYREHWRVEATLRSRRIIEQLAAEHGLPFVRCGKLLLGPDRAALEAALALRRQLGAPDGAVLEADEVRSLAPELRAETPALWCEGDGHTDGPLLCSALAEGVEVRQGTDVVAVTAARGRLLGVTTREGEIACAAVVNAAGAWARQLGALAGIEVPVDGYRRQVAVLEAERTLLPIVTEELGHGETLYLRAEGERHILAGLHSENSAEQPADPDRYAETPDQAFEARIAELLSQRLVNGGSLRLRGGWAGLYPIATGGAPIVAETEVSGFFVLAGLGGNGIQLGPALGEDAARLVLGLSHRRGSPQ